jgi:hypothetical protein
MLTTQVVPSSAGGAFLIFSAMTRRTGPDQARTQNHLRPLNPVASPRRTKDRLPAQDHEIFIATADIPFC